MRKKRWKVVEWTKTMQKKEENLFKKKKTVACRDLPSDLKPNKEVSLLKQDINKPWLSGNDLTMMFYSFQKHRNAFNTLKNH